ncbi:MAG: cyclase family protein [Chloroflexi bacterium]|nr:cyclase family protein [Chloroflexota bacterium]
MKIIDLSQPIREGLAVGQNQPPVEIIPIETNTQGMRNTKLIFSIHAAGTHIDAPWHIVPDGITVDEIPLDQMMGDAVRFDCRSTTAGEAIPAEELRGQLDHMGVDLEGKIVVISTGWSDRWYHSDHYYGHGPYLSREAAQWLASQHIKVVCLDFPPAGGTGGPDPALNRDVHLAFLGNDIPIIENLVGLDRLPAFGFTIIAFPLKVYRGNGAPARVVALVSE